MAKVTTIYEQIGGQPTVDKIIHSLYKHIGTNEKLLPIFPEDLEESARKQRLFLTQFFGGPNLYMQEIGRPMLPYRHKPSERTASRRDGWLACMYLARNEADFDDPAFSHIVGRLVTPAKNIVNTPDPSEDDI